MLIILSEASMERKDKDLRSLIQQRVKEEDQNAEARVLRDGDGDVDDLSLNIVERAFQIKSSESITVTNLQDAEKVTGSNDDFSQEKAMKSGTIPVKNDLVSSEKVDLFLGKANQAEKTEDFVDIIDNVVDISPVENHEMRKLLRGPRYFDPPENGCATCYNCGEEGHMSLHCTSARRKKPCFVCGSFEHNGRRCTSSKVRNCHNCKEHSHLAKDCPEKKRRGNIQNSKLCLKCGGYGHDMFSCSGNYCPDDLKEIQCYVCLEFGHLCCKDYPDNGPKVVSCYKCGFSGHTGLVCKGSNQASTPKKKSVKSKLLSEDVSTASPNNPGKVRKKRKANFEQGLLVCRTTATTGSGSVSSCVKCGEEGHLKSECRAVKWKNQVSNAKQKSVELPRDDLEVAPSACFKCGEEGHFKSECTNSKAAKRNHQASIVKQKSVKLLRDDSEVAPGLCFKCGEEGHFKNECSKSKSVKLINQGLTAKQKSMKLLRDDLEAAPGLCFKCGEEGHFKNECSNSKSVKLNNQVLTAKQKSVKLLNSEVAPSPSSKSFRKGRKVRTGDYEERDGWTSEHPRVFSYRNDRNAGWVPPATPLPYDIRVDRGSPATPFYYNGDLEVPPPSTNNIRSGSRKRKVKNEERLLPSSKSMHKHGWTSEHPGDLRNGNGRTAGWAPPAKPLPYDNGAKWGSSATPHHNNDAAYWGSHAMPCNNGVGWWDSPAAPYYNGGWGSPAAPFGYDNYAAFDHASTSYPANDTSNLGYLPSNGYQSGHYAPQFRNHNGGAARRHYHR